MELSELKIVPQFERGRVCCFTGNRPYKLLWGENESDPRCVEFKARLHKELLALAEEGYELFVSGMARGGDTLFAEAVLELKKTQKVALECAVPYLRQAASWTEKQRRRYEELLAAADYVTYISTDYTAGCLIRRNRYMVDKSSVIITLDHTGYGGTASTVRYAESKKLRIIALGTK